MFLAQTVNMTDIKYNLQKMNKYLKVTGDRHDHDLMEVEFITTYAISAYHH